MQQYKDKKELIEEIKNRYFLYDKEFEDIQENQKDKSTSGTDKTPSQNLSYQIGWTALLLHWETEELKGNEVITPTPDYKWNNLKSLYQSFYELYGNYSLKEQREMLVDNVNKILEWIENLDDDTLFLPEQRKWATTPAKWALWKWIHINTAAPFKNFRTQLRKWKKENDQK